MKRAIIFVRTELLSDAAFGMQHNACLDFCKRFNLEVVGTWVDIASGDTLTNRPKLDDLRRMVAASHINVVVTYTLDRLACRLVDLITLAGEARQVGADIVSVVGAGTGELTPFSLIAASQERERMAWLLCNAEYREQERWQQA